MGFFDGGISGLLSMGSNLLGLPFEKWSSDRANSFNETMSNSAWTRGVADMKRAGINPILAFDRGGASSPSASAMDIPNMADGVVSSALDAKRLKQDIAESETRIEGNLQKKDLDAELEKSQKGVQENQKKTALLLQTQAEGTRLDNVKKAAELGLIQNRGEFETKHKWLGATDAILDRVGSGARVFRDIFMGGAIPGLLMKYLSGQKGRNFNSAFNLKSKKWE